MIMMIIAATNFVTYFGFAMVFKCGSLDSEVLAWVFDAARSIMRPSFVGNLFVAWMWH